MKIYASDPREIYEQIVAHREWYCDYTIIVMGKHGPTGKTSLCDRLNHSQFNAIEISQLIFENVSYKDNDNHVEIDDCEKTIVIILNRPKS